MDIHAIFYDDDVIKPAFLAFPAKSTPRLFGEVR